MPSCTRWVEVNPLSLDLIISLIALANLPYLVRKLWIYLARSRCICRRRRATSAKSSFPYQDIVVVRHWRLSPRNCIIDGFSSVTKSVRRLLSAEETQSTSALKRKIHEWMWTVLQGEASDDRFMPSQCVNLMNEADKWRLPHTWLAGFVEFGWIFVLNLQSYINADSTGLLHPYIPQKKRELIERLLNKATKRETFPLHEFLHRLRFDFWGVHCTDFSPARINSQWKKIAVARSYQRYQRCIELIQRLIWKATVSSCWNSSNLPWIVAFTCDRSRKRRKYKFKSLSASQSSFMNLEGTLEGNYRVVGLLEVSKSTSRREISSQSSLQIWWKFSMACAVNF